MIRRVGAIVLAVIERRVGGLDANPCQAASRRIDKAIRRKALAIQLIEKLGNSCRIEFGQHLESREPDRFALGRRGTLGRRPPCHGTPIDRQRHIFIGCPGVIHGGMQQKQLARDDGRHRAAEAYRLERPFVPPGDRGAPCGKTVGAAHPITPLGFDRTGRGVFGREYQSQQNPAPSRRGPQPTDCPNRFHQ